METKGQKLPGEDPPPVDRMAPGRIETKGKKLLRRIRRLLTGWHWEE
jgi:hypothetical protein